MAAIALLLEWLGERAPELPALSRSKPTGANPWSGPIAGWMYRRDLELPGGPVRSDQQFVNMVRGAWRRLVDALMDDRKRAAAAWEAEQESFRQLFDENESMVTAYLGELEHSRRDTRRRVLIEMAGLLLAISGTLLT